MKESLFLVTAGLTIFGIAMGSFGCAYILNMFRVIYPDRLWLGVGYWPTIVLLVMVAALFVMMILQVVKRMVRGN